MTVAFAGIGTVREAGSVNHVGGRILTNASTSIGTDDVAALDGGCFSNLPLPLFVVSHEQSADFPRGRISRSVCSIALRSRYTSRPQKPL